MSKVQIYDKAMCCSTGVCGPQVDPVLPKFSADLDWLKSQGHDVVRFNLAQDPAEFAKNATVQKMLVDEGVESTLQIQCPMSTLAPHPTQTTPARRPKRGCRRVRGVDVRPVPVRDRAIA